MNQLIGYLSEGEQLKGSLTIPQKIGGGGGGTLETITKTYTPTTSQQTEQITPSSGYDGIAEVDVTVDAMPTGTEGTPTATKGTVSNHSVNVTPSVTNVAGYIAGGTKTGTAVTVSASELDSGTKSITANGNNQDVVGYAAVDVAVPNSYSAADEGKVVDNGALVAQTAHADVTPTTSDQTIDTTLNNSLKVKGDADLVAANIKKDVEIFGVTGSYEGGGGSGSIEHGTFTPTERLKSHTITTEQEKSNFVVFAKEGFSFSLGTAAMILMIYQGSYGVGTNNGGTSTGTLGSGQGTLTKSGNNFTYEAAGTTLGSSTRAWQAGVTYHWFAW